MPVPTKAVYTLAGEQNGKTGKLMHFRLSSSAGAVAGVGWQIDGKHIAGEGATLEHTFADATTYTVEALVDGKVVGEKTVRVSLQKHVLTEEELAEIAENKRIRKAKHDQAVADRKAADEAKRLPDQPIVKKPIIDEQKKIIKLTEDLFRDSKPLKAALQILHDDDGSGSQQIITKYFNGNENFPITMNGKPSKARYLCNDIGQNSKVVDVTIKRRPSMPGKRILTESVVVTTEE